METFHSRLQRGGPSCNGSILLSLNMEVVQMRAEIPRQLCEIRCHLVLICVADQRGEIEPSKKMWCALNDVRSKLGSSELLRSAIVGQNGLLRLASKHNNGQLADTHSLSIPQNLYGLQVFQIYRVRADRTISKFAS